jgi:hypothetical protein
MPQQRRPVTAAEVDILLAVEIPGAAASRSVEVERVTNRLVEPRRGRNPAGKEFLGLFVLGKIFRHEPAFSASFWCGEV